MSDAADAVGYLTMADGFNENSGLAIRRAAEQPKVRLNLYTEMIEKLSKQINYDSLISEAMLNGKSCFGIDYSHKIGDSLSIRKPEHYKYKYKFKEEPMSKVMNIEIQQVENGYLIFPQPRNEMDGSQDRQKIKVATSTEDLAGQVKAIAEAALKEQADAKAKAECKCK